MIINKEAATGKLKKNKRETLLNMSFSRVIATSELEKRTFSDKKITFCKKGSRNATCRKIKALCGNMENFDKGFRNFGTCGEILQTFLQESSLTKHSRNILYESRSKTPSASGNRQHVEEGSHMQN